MPSQNLAPLVAVEMPTVNTAHGGLPANLNDAASGVPCSSAELYPKHEPSFQQLDTG